MIGIIKPIIKVSSIIVLILIFCACSKINSIKNVIKKKNRLYQAYSNHNISVLLFYFDAGANGLSIDAYSFDKNENIDNLGLRGNDNIPIVDSSKNDTINIHYDFRFSTVDGIGSFSLEEVTLGE